MSPAVSPGSPNLLLFPTELERRRFEDHGGLGPGYALAATCGFGPIAAAARTAQLVALVRPRRLVLIGVAGAYDPERHPVGEAFAFSRVAVDGVGAGRGESFLGPPALGFPQWPGSETAPAVGDVLELSTPEGRDDGLLLTTCAASGSPEHARERLERFPEAVAEDMEGFGVALAGALAGVPTTVVRGISNVVGERDASLWRIPAALAAVRRLVIELLERDLWEEPA